MLCVIVKMEVQNGLLTTAEMSKIWGISTRKISLLCSEGRVEGAVKKGTTWLIPKDAKNLKIREECGKIDRNSEIIIVLENIVASYGLNMRDA
jgi:hypothetical protein